MTDARNTRRASEEPADGSNYRDDEARSESEVADGSSYREARMAPRADEKPVDGSNYRDGETGGASDVADGSSYRDDPHDHPLHEDRVDPDGVLEEAQRKEVEEADTEPDG
jgi:hypothetical protein